MASPSPQLGLGLGLFGEVKGILGLGRRFRNPEHQGPGPGNALLLPYMNRTQSVGASC